MDLATQQVKFWENRANELDLFNSIDKEYIYTSTKPCIVRLLKTDSSTNKVDNVRNDEYNEAPIKVYEPPVEIAGNFLPIVDTFEFTLFGGDFKKDATLIFNYKDWSEKLKREPKPGDLIKTPEFDFIFRVSDVQKIDPVNYGPPMHYQVKGVLDEDLQVKDFEIRKELSVEVAPEKPTQQVPNLPFIIDDNI